MQHDYTAYKSPQKPNELKFKIVRKKVMITKFSLAKISALKSPKM